MIPHAPQSIQCDSRLRLIVALEVGFQAMQSIFPAYEIIVPGWYQDWNQEVSELSRIIHDNFTYKVCL